MSGGDKTSPSLTIDRAAFLLLRVKKAFKKKKQQRCKDKSAAGAGAVEGGGKQDNRGSSRNASGKPAPLLRSRTLPAIVAPGLNILQAQIDARYAQEQEDATIVGDELALLIPPYLGTCTTTNTKRNSTAKAAAAGLLAGGKQLLAPRISFTDDQLERRVSDTGPNYRRGRAAGDAAGGTTGGSNKDHPHSYRGSSLSAGSGGSSSQPLSRLAARLLNQRPSFIAASTASAAVIPSDELPRRLSWERRKCSNASTSIGGLASSSCLARSSSIDSVAECWSLLGDQHYQQLCEQQQHKLPKRSPSPLLGATSRLDSRLASVASSSSSSSATPRASRPKGHRALIALFAAVENGNLDKARAILESTDVDINSVNSDGLSPLDVSVLSNNRSLSKMLVSFGAQEGNQFTSADSLGSHLALLLSEAEHRVQELSGGSSGEAVGFPSSSLGPSLALGAESTGAVQQFQPPHLSSGMPPPPPPPMSHRSSFSSQHNLTGCGGTAEDKQLALWERRARALRKMLYGFDQARPPDVPFLVTVDVTGVTSVTARFQESELCESFICTKFKIQWSTKEDFSTILGERELLDVKEKECSINNLIHGQKYYFRAAAGNIKGYSRFRPTTPAFLTPSSWRDVDSRINRFSGRLEQIDSLMVNIRGAEYSQETPALQRRNHKKKTTIKQLFTATSKFQKNLRRGVYLACLLYHEDKILVTNEDFLPVIEVDETYPSCIQNDYNWLIKVASTWDDLKSLKQDMEKCHSSSSQHFRIKLLQAAIQMQTAFGIQDLGQLFHKPIRDIQGTLVFSVINSVKSPKSVSMLNSRWLSVAKVTKKIVTHEDSNVADILMASIQSQINYHQVSSIKLNGGLYIGYLKMQSSVDSIQVVVPTKSPNFLPHCKIRDNSHVSAEEWECLKRVARMNPDNSQNREVEEKSEDEEKENLSYEFVGTEQQKVFIDQVAIAAKQLFSYMDINTNESHLHRIYDMEVIDLNDEVSFLVAVPPAETACSVPGTREILLQRSDLLSLPIQVFEMVHLNTYQKELINRYSRLSLLLELDTAQAQHSHREAFSNLELTVAKDKLTRLQDLQTQMNSVWKGARWLVDLITFARDRGTSSTSGGINIKNLLSLERNRSRSNSNNTNGNVNTLKRSLLQLPPRDPKLVKASPGRGSWPGPSVTNSNESSQINLLSQELSKSEQQLPLGSYSRKGSNSSNCSSVSEPYKSTWLKTSGVSNKLSSVSQQLYQTSQTKLPPSRSEDTLLVGKYKQHQQQPLVSRSSASSATTSPLLGMKLSVKSGINSASESAHSVSSEECPALSRSKLAKPTASVAAIADKSNSSELSTSDEFSGSQTLLPGILQVYAAYETGLASGTSLKLHVTGRTTAREVVDLVVKQLNMAVVLKGLEGPVYAQEELQNFCLVAVIGARERCLRDDFKPLQLQNPWKKGRLYVRQKQDVLAALEHSSKHTAYL